MSDDVTELENRRRAYDDGTLAKIRILAVPESDTYPDGLKYSFHYGVIGAADPIIRFDNHHGPHELHLGARTYEFEYPGLTVIKACWVAALPASKRDDWR